MASEEDMKIPYLHRASQDVTKPAPSVGSPGQYFVVKGEWAPTEGNDVVFPEFDSNGNRSPCPDCTGEIRVREDRLVPHGFPEGSPWCLDCRAVFEHSPAAEVTET